MSNGCLYISNYFKKIEVKWANIKQIKQPFILYPRGLKITFYNKTKFGKSVIFLSKPLGNYNTLEKLLEIKESNENNDIKQNFSQQGN